MPKNGKLTAAVLPIEVVNPNAPLSDEAVDLIASLLLHIADSEKPEEAESMKGRQAKGSQLRHSRKKRQ